MADLLQKLRTELDDLTRMTVARVANVPLRRMKDPRGKEVITVLAPTDDQWRAARSEQGRLTLWSRAVAAVLQRRGASAEVDKLARLTAEMTSLLLLERQDIAEVPEGVWRRGFESDLARTSVALEGLLSGAASFEIRQHRRAVDYAPFKMWIVQMTPEQWSVRTKDRAEMITPAGARNLELGADPEAIVAAGQALYRAVFTGAVRDAYLDALRKTSQDGLGLRIELHMDRAGTLSSAPWELLHDGRQFVAMCRGSAVTRVVEVQELRGTPAPVKPLRVLLTISSPRLLPWLDAERERQRIEAAVAPLTMLGMMELQIAPDGSLNTMRRMFASADASGRPFEGWHFIGHGEFDERIGRGTLAMTTDKREAHMVGGSELGTLLRDHPRLRFAIVNACEGARASPKGPMYGVATALIESGIERVVAMQFPISDRAAIVFAEELYGALADGATLDEAVVEGRRGIFFRPNATEWVTPVVFMSDVDGDIALLPGGETQK